MSHEEILLDKFLSSREGSFGVIHEYLYFDFPDETNYQLAKKWIQAALMFGYNLGKTCESLGMNPEDVKW